MRFSLDVSTPAGWTVVSDASTSSIAPGGRATSPLEVASPASAADGFYDFSVTATNEAERTSFGSATGTQAIISFLTVTVSTDRTGYTRKQAISITARVSANGSPVSGASVRFIITKANGSVVTDRATTGANGSATVTLRLHPQKDPTGVYTVSARAQLGDVSGTGTASFTVTP